MFFEAKLASNGDGGFVVRFASVPEAITEGATRAQALANASDALEVALFGRMKDGDDLPSPLHTRPGRNAVHLSAQASAKLALYRAFRESGMTRTGFAARLGLDEKEVRRTLDPYHSTRLSALETALAALGYRLELTVVEA